MSIAAEARILEESEDHYVDLSPFIRDLTQDEIDSFNENGWVFVRGFLKPELCEKILQHYMDWSGLHWREFPENPAEQEAFRQAVKNFWERPRGRFAIRQDDPWMFNYMTQRKLAEQVARLLNVPTIKPYSESLQVKQPEVSGQGNVIGWHQDFPSMSIDRAEAAQMWLALVPISTDMGPMVHLNGSHRCPPMGIAEGGEKFAETYPELFERFTTSQPHEYAQGDAVFHHCLTWHSSSPNVSNKVRWAMSNYRMSGRTRYTGQPNFNTDGLDLERYKPFDHPNFPTIYP